MYARIHVRVQSAFTTLLFPTGGDTLHLVRNRVHHVASPPPSYCARGGYCKLLGIARGTGRPEIRFSNQSKTFSALTKTVSWFPKFPQKVSLPFRSGRTRKKTSGSKSFGCFLAFCLEMCHCGSIRLHSGLQRYFWFKMVFESKGFPL